MKQAVLAVALCALSATGEAATRSTAEVRTLYEDLFTVSVSSSRSGKQVVAAVRDLPADHPLSVLTREHRQFLTFLLDNYSDVDLERLRRGTPEDASRDLAESIRRSDRLASVMLPLVVAILEERGDSVGGLRRPPARTITLAELMRVAVRFFYVEGFTRSGNPSARVCAGVNGLREAPFPRDPLLEAIAYSAIMRDWESDRVVMPEFSRALRRLGARGARPDDDAALAQARAEMWTEMSRSAPLAEILRKEVARTAHFANVSLRR